MADKTLPIQPDRIRQDIIHYLDTAETLHQANLHLPARMNLARAGALLVYIQDDELENRYQNLGKALTLAILPPDAKDLI